jgi:methionine-rich copper-binding protein CopC
MSRLTFPARFHFVSAVCGSALLLAASPSAWAHARLLKSTPAKQAELSKSPDHVDLWFNELLDEGFNTLEVYPSKQIGEEKHTNFAVDKPAVDSKDRTHLSIKVKSLPAGEYVVEWRVLSRDGHSAPGRLLFTVK